MPETTDHGMPSPNCCIYSTTPTSRAQETLQKEWRDHQESGDSDACSEILSSVSYKEAAPVKYGSFLRHACVTNHTNF